MPLGCPLNSMSEVARISDLRVLTFAFSVALFAAAAQAHVVSMSSGELIITGQQAHYELRMPLYEVAHIQAPERSLLSHLRFAGATLTASACSADPARDTYVSQ